MSYASSMSRSVPESLRPALSEYARRLREIFGDRVAEVRLFGSFARGEANEDSDVDVLVLINGLTDLEIGIAAGESALISVATGLHLAPLPMRTERFADLRENQRALARAIDAEGISL